MQAAILTPPLWYAQGLRWIASVFVAWARILERRSSESVTRTELHRLSREARRAEERIRNLRLWASIDAASQHLPFPGEEMARW